MSAKLSDVRQIDFPQRLTPEAVLSIYGHPADVPFPITRVFVVNAIEAIDRGAHAHRECQQLLVCVNGKVLVTVDDGRDQAKVELKQAGQGLFIPAGLWAAQAYEAGAILMVMASHDYEEADYIRNYADYLVYRQL
jgi:UDP-2-acetamido-3-amino-2,3-dideoxy-glucuronate N-acetyltransferase